MKVGILSGGSAEEELLRQLLPALDYLIAVDHGADAAAHMGRVPDMILGDFDSADPKQLECWQKQAGICWETHSPVKDETDTELALSLALRLIEERGEEDNHILLLAATGTRLDHTLGNIHAMKRALDTGISCEMVDLHNRITLINGSRTFFREKQYGKYISLLPLAGEVKGVTLRGFRFPLMEHTLRPGEALTVSNELVDEQGSLMSEAGILICFESRD